VTTISSSSTIGIVLSSPAYSNPVVINPGVMISGGEDGIAAPTGPWTIQNAGTLSGVGYGVNISTAVGTVFNAGYIVASGSSTAVARGVMLSAGGYVSNAASGTISSTGDGNAVRVETDAGTVVNAGTLMNDFLSRSALDLQAGGFVTNAAGGLIQSGAWNGIYATMGAVTIVNAGIITGGAGSEPGSGVSISGSGTVTNQSGGILSGVGYGVNVSSAAGTVFNAGQIVASGEGTTVTRGGVMLLAGGYVSNATTGTIRSTGDGNAVRVETDAGTVVNAGTLMNSFASRSALDLESGGFVTNAAGGLIQSGAWNGIYATGGR
jgi:hypothetical protein